MIRGLLVMMTGLTLVGGMNVYETTYVRDAEVTSVVEDIVTFTDTTGNDWEYELDEDMQCVIGDRVTLIMNTNHTDMIYDDIIVGMVGK